MKRKLKEEPLHCFSKKQLNTKTHAGSEAFSLFSSRVRLTEEDS